MFTFCLPFPPSPFLNIFWNSDFANGLFAHFHIFGISLPLLSLTVCIVGRVHSSLQLLCLQNTLRHLQNVLHFIEKHTSYGMVSLRRRDSRDSRLAETWFLVPFLLLPSSVTSDKLTSLSFSFFVYTMRVLSKMICKNPKSYKNLLSTLGTREFCAVRFDSFCSPEQVPALSLFIISLKYTFHRYF